MGIFFSFLLSAYCLASARAGQSPRPIQCLYTSGSLDFRSTPLLCPGVNVHPIERRKERERERGQLVY